MEKSVWTSVGVVTTPHYLATQAAISILKEGGTAIEATVAAAAVLAVVYPHMTGIGGDGFWLIFPPNGDPIVIDACGAAGSLATKNFYREGSIPKIGPKAANTVAGTIGGWQEALDYSFKLGYPKLSTSKLLADAIMYAEDGFPVSHSLRKGIKNLALTTNHELKTIFMPDGKVPKIGEKITQPLLAKTLDQLARNGLNSFYHGELAKNITKDMRALGMPITKNDLENFNPERKVPLQLTNKKCTVYNTPPPTQGLASLIILGILDKLNVDTKDETIFIHNIVEATKLAFEIRDKHITDPVEMKVNPQSFLTDENLLSLSYRIDQNKASVIATDENPGDTIWMGVMDNKGFSVSFIQSLFHEFGSKVVLPTSGIIWHNRGIAFSLKEGHRYLKPGKKPFHTLNPAGAKFSDGRIMVYGTRGGDGQPQTQAIMFDRYVNQGMNLQKCISEPRWLLGTTYLGNDGIIHLEDRFSEETLECLKRRGHRLNKLPVFADDVGYAGILVRHSNGMLEGGFDPRSDGSVAGY